MKCSLLLYLSWIVLYQCCCHLLCLKYCTSTLVSWIRCTGQMSPWLILPPENKWLRLVRGALHWKRGLEKLRRYDPTKENLVETYLSINQHQSVSISISQHQSASIIISISINQLINQHQSACQSASVSINQHQSASISINQHQSSSVRINQHQLFGATLVTLWKAKKLYTGINGQKYILA